MAVCMPVLCGFYCCKSVAQFEIRKGETFCRKLSQENMYIIPSTYAEINLSGKSMIINFFNLLISVINFLQYTIYFSSKYMSI